MAAGAVVGALALGACSRSATSGHQSSSPSAVAGAEQKAPLVNPDELVSGGPPPDGIPPIDQPKFETAADVSFLDKREPILAIEYDGVSKAYPLRIMTWHEIVNDEFGSTPITVTYCPLCNTGIAFLRPTINGQLLDFGTSGKLYNSNLVMWDRQTETYWAQATGQAIVGELVGEQLEFVPARILSWGDWLAANPDGLVLSLDTGFQRDYGRNPYAGYESAQFPFLFTGELDDRLPATEHVLGFSLNDRRLAVPFTELRKTAAGGWAAQEIEVGGGEFVVFWKAGTASALDSAEIPQGKDVGAAVGYVPELNGRQLTFEVTDQGIVDRQTRSVWDISGTALRGPLAGEQLEVAAAIDGFWFDWAAFHPDTEVWKAS